MYSEVIGLVLLTTHSILVSVRICLCLGSEGRQG